MDIAVVVAIIGSAGGFITAFSAAIFKILDWRKMRKTESWEVRLDARLAPILESNRLLHDENQEIRNELREVRLDTTRLQLLDLINKDPHNHDTILTVAHRYFVELKGNWVAAVEFQAWADQEKINIPLPIMQAIAENESCNQK